MRKNSGDALALIQHFLHQLPMHIGQPVMPPLVLEGQSLVVDAKAVEHRGVEVVNVHGIGGYIVGEVVRLANGHATLDTRAGQPDGEAARMMIAPIVGRCQLALAIHRAPKLAAPHHQRVFQKPTLF